MTLIRLLVIGFATTLVWYISYPHVLYHWIKGKSFIKLYSLMVIMEMADLLLRSVGDDLTYSLS